MVRAKNYETMSTSVKVMQKKLWPLFFPDTVYVVNVKLGHNNGVFGGIGIMAASVREYVFYVFFGFQKT